MENISFFLAKFKTLGLESVLIKRTFLEVVKEVIGKELNPQHVVIKNGIVFVTERSAMKNELYIQKTKILAALEGKLGVRKVDTVRY